MMAKEVYVLINHTLGRTLCEYAEGGEIVTLAFRTKPHAHDYRNRHGLPVHLQPMAVTVAKLDEASQRSLSEYGEAASWRLVENRSEPPVILADRVDPCTGEVYERCTWGEYWNGDWVWREVLAEMSKGMVP